MKEVVEWSACTYGASCKRPSCDKVVDQRREKRWKEFSKDESIKNFYDEVFVPGKYLHDIRVPTGQVVLDDYDEKETKKKVKQQKNEQQ